MGIPGTAGATGTQAGATPTIRAVHFSRIGPNLHIEVDGAGFGPAGVGMPHVGTVPNFSFQDVSRNWGAGMTNASEENLQYTLWTDTRIVVDGLDPNANSTITPGDSVSITIRNTTSTESTLWTGVIKAEAPPPLDPGGPTPIIAAIQFSRIGPKLHIEIDGAGFGPAGIGMPLVGTVPNFSFQDVSRNWGAGMTNDSEENLQYTSWSDTRIVVDGLDPNANSTITPGDSGSIFIQNATSTEVARWTGIIRPGIQEIQSPGPGPTPKPASLQLAAPAQNATLTSGPVQFSWTSVPGAIAYYLDAYLVKAAPDAAITASTSMNISWQGATTSYSLDTTHLVKGTYRWRVAAIDQAGALIQPGWTAERTFTLA
jgi:hypothetical protein